MSNLGSSTGQPKTKPKALVVQTVWELRGESENERYWHNYVPLVVLYPEQITVRIAN